MARWFAVLIVFAATVTARADIVMIIDEVGSDVVLSYTGFVDVSELVMIVSGTSLYSKVIFGSSPVIQGGASPTADGYGAVVIPGPVGPGGPFFATSSTGDAFGFNHAASDLLLVPSGFVSGTLTGSSTWAGTTISALGLTPGTYHVTWGGADELGETATLTVVPEPSSVALAVVAAAVGATRRRRRAGR